MYSSDSNTSESSRVIVLLHGFAAHWVLMTRLQNHFRTAGHRTVNWGYKSWFQPIDQHAVRLQDRLAEIDEDDSIQTIDFVTHSMGCIVMRAALNKCMPKKAGRWVMLAPPNRGSYWTSSVPRFVKRVMKPLEELQVSDDSYVNSLPIPGGIDIAVVQATADYIVAEPLTRIAEENARIVVPGLHSQILFQRVVAVESLHFLQHGRFSE